MILRPRYVTDNYQPDEPTLDDLTALTEWQFEMALGARLLATCALATALFGWLDEVGR